ncbi:MAG TPA: hypothetical protein PKI32_02030, partial [Opitutales bacterium]|nr:hypothetical protein [Opitutales bacterium]
QTYYKAVRVDQAFTENVALDRILAAWLREYSLAKSLEIEAGEQPHTWFWDGMEHVDPAKEASAQETKLNNRTTSLAAEYARQGKDWETEIRQIAKEKKLMKELGVEAAEAVQKPKARNEEENERTE